MTEVFSSNSELVLQRVVDAPSTGMSTHENIEQVYQIIDTCQFINQHKFLKVALQFPDELLADSVAISEEIGRRTQAKLFILGDTSYGSCCVDEVAAQHVGADCIVHYGRACLSPSTRLPLMYVFERGVVDLKQCASAFRELYSDRMDNIIVLYDVNYAHVADDLLEVMSSDYPNIVCSTLTMKGQCGSHGKCNDRSQLSKNCGQIVSQFGRQFVLRAGLTMKDYSVFFIGQEGATIRNFMMTWNFCKFCSFNPATLTGRTESVSVNRALMKRYYAVERAKDASVVGILVGTLGVADYLTIIRQLKEVIHKAGKKSYMFVMGKLNVAKLANFLEIDIYVLIACPENSLLDYSDFYKPVITPFEMELACNKNRVWSEEYITDFRHLLPGGQNHVPLTSEAEEDCDETDVSLITGALRRNNLLDSEPVNESSMVLRNKMLTVANPHSAAQFLAGRSWQGLEQRLGETPVKKAVEGRKGIAIAYEDEKENV